MFMKLDEHHFVIFGVVSLKTKLPSIFKLRPTGNVICPASSMMELDEHHIVIFVVASLKTKLPGIFKLEPTGNVICPASSMMHVSNFLCASKGWYTPKQVTPTTCT